MEKDQPVATRAHIKENLDTDGLNKMRAPKKTIAELGKQGYIPAQNYDKDSLAFPMMLMENMAMSTGLDCITFML